MSRSPAPATPDAHAVLERRVADFRAQDRLQASSLITSVFGDAILPRGGRVWLGSLIELLGPLGVNERLVRTSVFRLVKDEWLQTEAVGRRTDYMLTPLGRKRFEEAARHIYAQNSPPWDRRWRLLTLVGSFEPREREAVRRSLVWQGFGELQGALYLHPSADLGLAAEGLIADGLKSALPRLMPLLGVGLQGLYEGTEDDLVRAAWDLQGLAAHYHGFVQTYQPILDALVVSGGQTTAPELAFMVRTLLIHDYRKLLLRDPELPDELLPRGWAGATARRVCAEIYRRLCDAADRHLDGVVRLADGTVPELTGALSARFAPEAPAAARLDAAALGGTRPHATRLDAV